MEQIKRALESARKAVEEKEKRNVVTFEECLQITKHSPRKVLRNIFQLFYDFVAQGVIAEKDEYPDDPESIGFVKYNCEKIFVEGRDTPFFADRLFANRFVRLVGQMRIGAAEQNKVYIFVGPHGSGKSVFLNNLLAGFGEYTDLPEGEMFELLWRIDPALLKNHKKEKDVICGAGASEDILEIPCPSHDNPFLIFPKRHRWDIIASLLEDSEERKEILNSKEYEWLFRDSCCPICRSIFYTLLDKLENFEEVQKNIFVRTYKFDRVLGEGISVFSPGDIPSKLPFLTDKGLQERINNVFGSSNAVKYIFSRFAKTNQGIYALMDVKEYNRERFSELRGIVSEGIHKLDECIEEGVRSLFLVVANPEDIYNDADLFSENLRQKEKNSRDKKRSRGLSLDEAFKDRLQEINISYLTEVETEVRIYESTFGSRIREHFLPDVLENFARVVISSRLVREPQAIKDWIGDLEKKYSKYCDKDGLLLKMSIYSGIKPRWLSEEDVREFTKEHRKNLILKEGEKEGKFGFSGRDSVRLFNRFFSLYASKKGKLITMADLSAFFKNLFKKVPHYKEIVPKGFLNSLLGWYNYTVVQQIKESLYDYNERQIKEDIIHYIVATSLDIGEKVVCEYTGKTIEVTEDFLQIMEDHIWGEELADGDRELFRQSVIDRYSRLVAQHLSGLKIEETELFEELYKTYMYQLKEKAIPFLRNKSFREAIKAYGKKEFETFDKRVKENVVLLINNLCEKYRYTKEGAKEVCIYAIDNKIFEEFEK